jgi:hypothetical protein
MDEPELNLLFFVLRSTPMVKSGVAALHVQLCPRNLSRELDLDSAESTTEQPAQRVLSMKMVDPVL